MDINGIRSRGKLSKKQKNYYPLDWNFIFQEQSGLFQCSYCGKFITDVTEDHIYPKSLGGTSITSACDSCNQMKENMLPIQWAIFAYENNIDIGVGIIVKRSSKLSKSNKSKKSPVARFNKSDWKHW